MNETHEYFTGLDRPQTAKKLSILRKYFAVWLTIWSGDQCSGWVSREWHVLDLLAGTGQARGAQGELLSGSPLVFLEEIRDHADRLAARGVSIRLTFVEQDPARFRLLEERVAAFLAANRVIEPLVEVVCALGDANAVARDLQVEATKQTPCFLFVDPFGTEIRHETMAQLVSMPWALDVLFNYMVESIRRVYGAASGSSSRAEANERTLQAFFGPEAVLVSAEDVEDPATYAHATFTPQGHKAVAFRMKKPGSNATQYILLFTSRHDTVIKIMRDVYAKEMTDHYGQASLLSTEEYLDTIEVIG
jgi:three-Cys-motif partner protein